MSCRTTHKNSSVRFVTLDTGIKLCLVPVFVVVEQVGLLYFRTLVIRKRASIGETSEWALAPPLIEWLSGQAMCFCPSPNTYRPCRFSWIQSMGKCFFVCLSRPDLFTKCLTGIISQPCDIAFCAQLTLAACAIIAIAEGASSQ